METSQRMDPSCNLQSPQTPITVLETSHTDYTDAVDKDASPKKRIVKNRFISVCSYILIMEMCERLAYFTFQTNLVLYIQKKLDYSSNQASMYTAVFSSLVYITPLFAAYVADTMLGRYKTILWFSILYTIGLALISVASWPTIRSSGLFFFALYGLICTGSGGIKANVITLGADQYDSVTEVKEMNRFFNWFYWANNIGAIIATAYMADFAISGSNQIGKKYSFSASFIIAAILFLIAMVVFYLGRKKYYRIPPSESDLAIFCSIVWYAAKFSIIGKAVITCAFTLAACVILNIVFVFVPQNLTIQILTYVVGALVLLGIIGLIFLGKHCEWVNVAKVENGGYWTNKQVRGSWELLRLLPYLGFMVPFWMVYLAMNGPWINQGCQMDCRVFSKTKQYNPGAWGVWNIIVILVFIPILDIWIYPFLGKLLKQSNGPTALQKIGAGFVFALLALVCSAIVEVERRKSPIIPNLNSICANEETGEHRDVSVISIWYQVPQYCFLGLAEILAVIAAYDLFYNQVPDNVKSACQGINLLTTALGGTLTSMVQNVLDGMGYLPTNLDNGRQEYIYYVEIAIGLSFFILFLFFSQSFEYKEDLPTALQVNDERKELNSSVRVSATMGDHTLLCRKSIS